MTETLQERRKQTSVPHARKFIPWGTRIAVIPDEPGETFVKDGKVVRPETSAKYEVTGTVVAVGDKVTNPAVVPGIRVVYPMYAGVELQLEDDEGKSITILAIEEKQIVGTIEGDNGVQPEDTGRGPA